MVQMTVTHLIGTVGSSRGVPILNHQIEQTSKFYFTEGIWQSRGKVGHDRPSRDYFKSLKEIKRIYLMADFAERF